MKYLIFSAALVCLAGGARADSEFKVTIDRGSYIQVASVTGSSIAGTAIMTADPKRTYAILSTNTGGSGGAVFIGTVAATQHGATHTNITNGFPVASTSTFTLDGAMTDTAYFTCATGVATCQIRVLQGLNR